MKPDVLRWRLPAAVLTLLVIASVAPRVWAQEPQITHAQPMLRVEPLKVVTHRGAFPFKVEIARTPRQQDVGLMFRPVLAPDRGMLFEFKTPQDAYFWMKNCPHPLDMLFIEADGTVLSIANAPPNSTDPIPSGGKITGVLEIRGGRAAEIGAQPGDQVRHGFFRHG